MNTDIHVPNLIPGKTAETMEAGDTLCCQKTTAGGCIATLYCRVISIKRGTITAKVLAYEPDWVKTAFEGVTTTTRWSKCYLWGKGPGDSYERCHWFTPSPGYRKLKRGCVK